jgi:hypothetical protein
VLIRKCCFEWDNPIEVVLVRKCTFEVHFGGFLGRARKDSIDRLTMVL